MARAIVVVSSRVCVTAARWVVAGTVVAFTVWVFLGRDVRGSSSSSALVSLVSWFGFSLSPLGLSTPSSSGVEAGLTTLTLFIKFLGWVPSLAAQGLSQLAASAAYGPSLARCGGFDLFFRSPSPARLHSFVVELVAPRLQSFLGDPADSHIHYSTLMLPLAILMFSFKLWLYRVVVPSFHDIPMGFDERRLLSDVHHWLVSFAGKLFAPLRRHRLSLSFLLVCSLHHMWLSLDPDVALLSVAVNNQLCFKPDTGITHCYDYSISVLGRIIGFLPTSTSVFGAWTPLARNAMVGLAATILAGYWVYWHMLIFIVVRAHLLRKAGRFLTALRSLKLIHSSALDAARSTKSRENVSFTVAQCWRNISLEAGRLETIFRTGGDILFLLYGFSIGLILGYLANSDNAAGPTPTSEAGEAEYSRTDSDLPSNASSDTSNVCEPRVAAAGSAYTEDEQHNGAGSVASTDPSSGTTALANVGATLNSQTPAQILASLHAGTVRSSRRYSHRFPEGHRLAADFLEDYDLTKQELAADQTGFRLKARSRRSGRWVSVKFLSPNASGSRWVVHPEYGYIPYEVVLGQDLSHHNIVSTMAIFKDESGWFYMVQDFGVKLVDCIASAQYKHRRVDMARFIFTQIVAGVHYLDQRGLAHGDLSLDNIIITELAEVKIIGLFSVKSSTAGNGAPLLYDLSDYNGEELYAPPEVLERRRHGQYSPSRADIWSLGVILFELLLGYVPFSTKAQIIELAKSGDFPVHEWAAGDAELLNDVGVSPLLGLCCLQGIPANRSTIGVLKAHEWLRRTDIPDSPSFNASEDVHPTIPTPSPPPLRRAQGLFADESESTATLSKLKKHFSLDITLNQDFARTYRLGALLGAGGFGCVVKACHRTDGREVAFKFIRKSGVLPPAWMADDCTRDDGRSVERRRVPMEVGLVRRARHENVARALDVYEDADFFYIGIELHGSTWTAPGSGKGGSSGNSLHDFLRAHGPLSEDLARYVFGQIVEAVYYLRSIGISHGDIKPANVLVDDHLRVKLIDFGNAVLDDPALPPDAQFRDMEWYTGTTVYMPPECFHYPNRADVPHRIRHAPADVWSLGILLVELLTGAVPFCTREEVRGMGEGWREGVGEEVAGLVGGVCLVGDVGRRGTVGDVRAHGWLVGWRGVRGVGDVVRGVLEVQGEGWC